MPTVPFHRSFRRPAGLGLALALALGPACFGVDVDPAGGPAGPEPPGAPPPSPVTQPLGVQGVAPAADATGVPLDAVVEVTFNRAVDPGSVDAGSFRVVRRPGVEDLAVPGVYGFAQGGRVVTFRPAGGFANNTEYGVTLTGAIRSADGQGPAFTGAAMEFVTARVVAQHSDPAGDTFERVPAQLLTPPDLVGLTVQQRPDGLQLTLTFENPVDPRPGQVNAVGGFVDLDLDQDASTGEAGAVEQFGARGGADTGLGVEVVVELLLDGTAVVYGVDDDGDSDDEDVRGTLSMRVEGRVVEFTIPYVLLGGDDGNVRTAAVVGTRIEATDVAPDTGHLQVGTAPRVGPGSAAVAGSRAAGFGRAARPHGVEW